MSLIGMDLVQRLNQIDQEIRDDSAAGYDVDALLEQRLEVVQQADLLMRVILARS